MPKNPLQIGSRAPAFELSAYPIGSINLAQFKGKKNVVLYFYPRDHTPGCTREACGFRDMIAKLAATDTVVLGVSTDSVDSHRKFTEKNAISFPLLSDPNHEVAEKYGVWVEKSNYGKKYMGLQRATFLISKEGKISAIWPKVKVEGHVQDVFEAIQKMS